MAKLPQETIVVIEQRGYRLGCTTTFEKIYNHFENHKQEVMSKEEILDEISLVIDEFLIYENLKEALKEQK